MALLRELFPGGNTPQGFYNLFEDIAADADYLYLLKGGAGVGKSSMMRKIGRRMIEEGYDVEYYYCSSDPRSLDGLTIRQLKIAMMDATAPHARDPKAPGLKDEIVYLGSNWNQAQLARQKTEALALLEDIAACFARGARYLSACAPLCAEVGRLYDEATLPHEKKRLAELFLFEAESYGMPVPGARVRHFFASAIGHLGWYNHLDSLKSRKHRFILESPTTDYWSGELFEFVQDLAANSVEAIACRDPLNPEKIVHVDLPAADVSVMTSCKLHPIAAREGDTILDSAEVLDAHKLSTHYCAIEPASEKIDELLALSCEALRDGMQLHDDLEKIYINAMDFAKNDRMTGELISRMLNLR